MSPGTPDAPEAPRRGRLLGKTFLALRNRNFRLFFIGQIVPNTGNWLTNVALALLVLKITGSGFAVGVLAACQFGPILFLSAWAGAVADRSNKRRMLMLTQSLEMAQSIGLAILAFTPHPPLGGLYALAVAGGILLAFDNPLRRSFVTEMVPAEDRPNAVVLYSVIVNVARIFGPALAGLLVVTLGFGWCFTIDAGSYLAVLGLHRPHAHGRLHRRPREPRTRREVRAGLRYVLSMPVALDQLRHAGLHPDAVVQLHRHSAAVRHRHAAAPQHRLHGPLLRVRRRRRRVRSRGRSQKPRPAPSRRPGAFALGLAMLLLAFVPGVGLAVPAVFLVGMASILYLTATTAIVQVEARPEMHGRVLALQTVLFGGGTFIGGPILG